MVQGCLNFIHFTKANFLPLATNFIHEERITKHEYSPMDIPKKIRSTHIPAGLYGKHTYFEKKSQAIPWDTQEVGEFLSRIGYAEYVPIFKDNVSIKSSIPFFSFPVRLLMVLRDLRGESYGQNILYSTINSG